VTWDDVIALALGGIGLSPAVFWRLSMREWILLQRGFFDKQENDYKNSWDQMRWQTYILALPNAKKGMLNKPEDLVRFPWDAPKENPAMSDEEQAEFVRMMGTRIENGKFVN
jgi:hypothetical protein